MIRAGSLEQKEAVARDAATARRLKEEAHDRWRMAWRIAAKVVDRLPLRATDGWTNVGLTNVQRMHKRIRMAVARRYDSSYRRLLQHFMRALDVVYNQTLRACDTDRSMCLTQKDIANSIHALLTQWNADYLGDAFEVRIRDFNLVDEFGESHSMAGLDVTIPLNPACSNIKVAPTDPDWMDFYWGARSSLNSDAVKVFYHPHIGQNGNMCYGEGGPGLTSACISYDLCGIMTILDTLIHTYNESDVYAPLSSNSMCASCGGEISSDVGAFSCRNCDQGPLCTECSHYCECDANDYCERCMQERSHPHSDCTYYVEPEPDPDEDEDEDEGEQEDEDEQREMAEQVELTRRAARSSAWVPHPLLIPPTIREMSQQFVDLIESSSRGDSHEESQERQEGNEVQGPEVEPEGGHGGGQEGGQEESPF